MKKILIPILSIGAIAPATGSIASCSCNSDNIITLEFTDKVGEWDDCLYKKDLKITANKNYKIVCDFSTLTNKQLSHFKGVVTLDFYELLGDSATSLKLNEDMEITFNGNVVDKSKIVIEDENRIKLSLREESYENTDKIVVTCSLQTDTDKGLIILEN